MTVPVCHSHNGSTQLFLLNLKQCLTKASDTEIVSRYVLAESGKPKLTEMMFVQQQKLFFYIFCFGWSCRKQ